MALVPGTFQMDDGRQGALKAAQREVHKKGQYIGLEGGLAELYYLYTKEEEEKEEVCRRCRNRS